MRGSIKARGKGTWRIRVYLGEVDGKKKYLSRTVHGKKEDAQKVLTAILREMDTGGFVDPAKISFEEVVRRWFEHDAADLGVNTRDTYEDQIENHIIPQLGAIKLSRLTSMMIEDYYQGRKLAGLAPSTIRKHASIIRQSLEYARRHRMVGHNVALAAKAPKTEKPDPKYWTLAEAKKFMEAAQGDRLQALWYLMLTTGGRIGELLALKWSDIDWDNSQISIDETLIRPGREPVFDDTKTVASERILWVMERELALLKAHRARQAKERLFYGPDYHDYDLVFPTRHGTPLSVDNLRRREYRRIIDKAKIPYIPPHGLRHTCASLLLAAGVRVHVVAERLGHASPEVTMKIYAHVYKESSQEATEILDMILNMEESVSEESGRSNTAFGRWLKIDDQGMTKDDERRSG